VLDVSRSGRHVATLRPSEGFYDSGDPGQGSVGHLIGGQAVSHVSMDAGITRDVWSAVAPDIETPRLKRIIAAGDRTIPLVRPDEGLIAVAVMAREYLKSPPPAQFHLIVSPLVIWIWIGGAIAVLGALIALWPAPRALRRRLSSGPGEALQAAREAKYREIHDAELDYRTGKLSDDDYRVIDGALRVEALEILDRLGDLEQDDRVHDEHDREEDRPAIEVALDHRPAAERAGAAADAEGAGEPRILAGVHQHEQDQHDGDDDLDE
jgi:hypothetical protein